MTRAKHPRAGHLYTEYYVVCGKCGYEMPVGAQEYLLACKYLDRTNWQATQEYGWTCHACLDDIREGVSETGERA